MPISWSQNTAAAPATKPRSSGGIDWGNPYKGAPITGSPSSSSYRLATRKRILPTSVQAPGVTFGSVLREVPGAAAKLGKGIANFFTQSEQRAGKSLGQSLYVAGGGQKEVDRITKSYMDDGDRLMKHASTITSPARKAQIIQQAQQSYQAAGATSEDIMGHIRDKKELIGDAAGVLLDALSFGTYGKAVQGVAQTGRLMKAAPTILGGTQKATTFGKGFVQGAKTSMKATAPISTGYGLAQGLQENKDTAGILKSGLTTGATGTVLGGVLGGLVGGLSARAAKLRADKATARQIESFAQGQPGKQIALKTPESPLLTEARKYKSAKEFANAQPKVYHGGSPDIQAVDTGKSNWNDTFYVSDKPSYAKSFGGSKSSLNEMVIDPKANLVDMRKPSDTLIKQIDGIASGTKTGRTITIPKPDGTSITVPTTPKNAVDFGAYTKEQVIQGLRDGKAHFAELPEVKAILKQLGYDGQITAEVPYAKNIGVWNKDIIKTKSQLTSIWEEANKVATINAGGKTTPKQNKQLQDVIRVIKGQGGARERGFITTMKESARTPQPVKDIIRGSYVPKTNTSLVNDAKTLVMADPAAAEVIALNPRNAVDIEVANQLMARYQASGNIAKIKQIGEAMASSGTELGQAVQAFSNYDKTTPQGAIRYATSVIKQHNALGKNVVKLTDDHIQTIYDAAAKIQELPMGRERNIATQQLMEEVNNLIPSSFADKAITVWKAGLLTSLRTHERNIIGNTIQASAELAKDVPGTMADVLMSARTGQRTTTMTARGAASGAKKGRQAAIDIVRTGYDPEQSIQKFDIRHVTWGNNPVERGLKKFTDVVFRTLGAEDKIFLNATYARSLYDQAGAAAINAGKRGNRAFIEALVKSPTDDMILNATKDSMYATFHDKNMLSTVISKAKNAMSAHEWSKIGGEIIAPFTGVPSSILGKVVDYSPVGLANGIRHAGIVLTKNVPALQRQAAQEIGRGTIGTGIFGLGAYLAKRGLLTGQPKNPEESRQWELENKKPNSVFIAGKWRSIQSVGPQTLIILAGGKAAQEMSTGGGGLGSFAGGVGKDFLGQSFLAGVQGPLQAITDPNRYGQSYLKSQLGSVIPNIVKDTARAFDPNQRQTNSVLEGLMSGIPGLRNKLLPKRDALGNVLTNDVPGIGSYVDLFTSSQPKRSPIVDELARLNEAGTPGTPSKINPKMTINKQKITLSPSGLNDLAAASSGELQQKLNELVRSGLYKMLSDDQRIKAIDKVVGDVRDKYKDNLPPILSVESTYTKSPDSSSNVFDLVARYGEGFIKDPAQTLRALFTSEQLRKVVGNATILERKDFLSLLDKGDKGTVVDHIIPLTLGGTNDESNLRVVSRDENQKKATVELMLFNLLKRGTITRQEAQRRIKNWRNEL